LLYAGRMSPLARHPVFQAAAWSLFVSLLALNSDDAGAAYSHPVTWADISAIDLRPAFRSQYASPGNLYQPAIPESAMDIALRDADAYIVPEFHVPRELTGPVRFWMRIYTEFTTQHVVLFDEHHPEIVYEVLDFRELANTARNRVVYEIVSHQRVLKARAAYDRALAQLARHPHPKKPTREQANILKAVQALDHRHSFAELRRNLRSQVGQRDNIIKGLLAAESFFPKMERIFAEMKVPRELTRIPLVESSFDLSARSKVGASGVWQFMPLSGREYLTISEANQIDERISPLKATIAAAKLLKRNRKILGNWALSVTAFNHGTKGLPKLDEDEADFKRFAHLFDPCFKRKGRKHLAWAGRNYYAEFLAVLHADAYRKLFYGEAPATRIQNISFRVAPAGKTPIQFSMETGISLQEFRLYNPDYMNLHRKFPKKYMIAVPTESDDLAGLSALRPSLRRS
jgi:membrane-bound lytic murein transglycosylase D